MSQSIEEIAQEHIDRATALRRIAKAFPEATFDVLWDNGPRVPVSYQRDALDIATGVFLATSGKRIVLLPYVEMGKKGASVRCYVMPQGRFPPDAQTVLDRLDLATTISAMRDDR